MKSAKAKSQRRTRRKAKKARRPKRSPRGKLRKAIQTFLPSSIFAGCKAHGNTQWKLDVLPFVALFWSLSSESTLGDRFRVAADVAGHWFPRAFVATSYRGFVNALVTHNAAMLHVICARLRQRMLALEDDRQKIAGLTPFVVDGSKVAAPCRQIRRGGDRGQRAGTWQDGAQAKRR